jgi:hypothetical protein
MWSCLGTHFRVTGDQPPHTFLGSNRYPLFWTAVFDSSWMSDCCRVEGHSTGTPTFDCWHSFMVTGRSRIQGPYDTLETQQRLTKIAGRNGSLVPIVSTRKTFSIRCVLKSTGQRRPATLNFRERRWQERNSAPGRRDNAPIEKVAHNRTGASDGRRDGSGIEDRRRKRWQFFHKRSASQSIPLLSTLPFFSVRRCRQDELLPIRTQRPGTV